MDALELRKIMLDMGLTITEGSDKIRFLHFERTLKIIIPPKNQSDRTNIRNIVRWVNEKCDAGVFDINETLARIIDFALEASGPESRVPAAVFMHVLKKELAYPK